MVVSSLAGGAFHHGLLVQRLVVGRRRERLLADIQHDLGVVVLVTGQLEVLEADRDVLLADAEEAADADQRGEDLAAPIRHEIVDVADRLILAVDGRLADDGAGKDVVSLLLVEELSARSRGLSRLLALWSGRIGFASDDWSGAFMFGSDGMAEGDSGCIGACMPGSCGGELGVSGDCASAGAAPMQHDDGRCCEEAVHDALLVSFEMKRTRIDTNSRPRSNNVRPVAIVPRSSAKCHSSVH